MLARTWTLADRLIVGSLTLTMDAAGQVWYIAIRLREEARGNRTAVEHAVRRMRRALHIRPSEVGERVLAALLGALELIDTEVTESARTDVEAEDSDEALTP